MDSDVVVPQFSYSVEDEKSEPVRELENEQQRIERELRIESQHPLFPRIKQHFMELIEQYNDIRCFMDTTLTDRQVAAKIEAKAAIVAELYSFLTMIDQINQVETGDGRE